MKIAELKKLLKTSKFNVSVSCAYGEFAKFILQITIGENWPVDLFISAQANMLRLTDSRDWHELKGDRLRTMDNMGHFYGSQFESVMVPAIGSFAPDLSLAQAMARLIGTAIDKYNLRHVTNCEATQIVKALESYGAKLTEVTVNNEPYRDWRRRQVEQQRNDTRTLAAN